MKMMDENLLLISFNNNTLTGGHNFKIIIMCGLNSMNNYIMIMGFYNI
jgi:hypothetical protein